MSHPAAPVDVPALDVSTLGQYDFLDFGAGVGASMTRCQKLFGGRGLGIEVNKKKIAEARRSGHEVVYGDIYSLPRRKTVRYICMDNVLEHLPSLQHADDMLAVAVSVAREWLFIRHPSFEDEAFLRTNGLKQYWHDWTGHPSHILLSDFVAMLQAKNACVMDVQFRYPAWDSSDPSILPVGAPTDQFEYDEAKHGPRPLVNFVKPVFRQLVMTVWL